LLTEIAPVHRLLRFLSERRIGLQLRSWFADLVGTKAVPDPDKAAKLDGERDYPRSKGNLPKFRPRTGADGVFSHCSSSVA